MYQADDKDKEIMDRLPNDEAKQFYLAFRSEGNSQFEAVLKTLQKLLGYLKTLEERQAMKP